MPRVPTYLDPFLVHDHQSLSSSSPKVIPFVVRDSQTIVNFIDPATVTAAPVSAQTSGMTFGCRAEGLAFPTKRISPLLVTGPVTMLHLMLSPWM